MIPEVVAKRDETYLVFTSCCCSGTGDQLKILARQPDTTVTLRAGLDAPESIMLSTPGVPETRDVRPEQFVTLTSDKPILVAQFIQGLVSGGANGK